MSYDICKRITLNEKENSIRLCIACSNVTPKTYKTYEMADSKEDIYKDFNFEDKLILLFRNMLCVKLENG